MIYLSYGLWWQEQKQLDNPRALLNHPLPSSYPPVYISTVSTLSSTHPVIHKFCVGTYQNPIFPVFPLNPPHFSIP
ncbi:hypothetical protein L1887_10329 [Cichorium endivia]|nr:hypothetical protein L1887_10329 [Cichorium endivia]